MDGFASMVSGMIVPTPSWVFDGPSGPAVLVCSLLVHTNLRRIKDQRVAMLAKDFTPS